MPLNWKTNYWIKESDSEQYLADKFQSLPAGWSKAMEKTVSGIYYINLFRKDGLGLRIEKIPSRKWSLSTGFRSGPEMESFVIERTTDISHSNSKIDIFREAYEFMERNKLTGY